MRTRLLLLHGVATTGAIWQSVREKLGSPDGFDVIAPDRPASGDLETELAWLAPLAEGSVVVGFSGGATLGLALASTDVRMAAAVLHEPAVGSLAPGLLAPIAAAYDREGYRGFGAALYGDAWQPDMVGDDGASVGRELPMFRAFEPAAPSTGQGRVVVTVGELSPGPRHTAARALRDRLGFETLELANSDHFVVATNPDALVAVIRSVVDGLGDER